MGGRCTALKVLAFTAMLLAPHSVAAVCPGDCDGNGRVTVDELVRGVSIALGSSALTECAAMDSTPDQIIQVNELVKAVSAALGACPTASPTVATPTPRVSPTAAVPSTVSPTNSPPDIPTPTPHSSDTPLPIATATDTASPNPHPPPTLPPDIDALIYRTIRSLAYDEMELFRAKLTGDRCVTSAQRSLWVPKVDEVLQAFAERDIPVAAQRLGSFLRTLVSDSPRAPHMIAQSGAIFAMLFNDKDVEIVVFPDPSTGLSSLRSRVSTFDSSSAVRRTLDPLLTDQIEPTLSQNLGNVLAVLPDLAFSSPPRLPGDVAFEMVGDTLSILLSFDAAALIQQFRDAITANDLDLALSFILEARRPQYRADIERIIRDDLDAQSMFTTNLTPTFVGGTYRGYRMLQQTPNGSKEFDIDFALTCDGRWKIAGY